jgi:hypothetical protein
VKQLSALTVHSGFIPFNHLFSAAKAVMLASVMHQHPSFQYEHNLKEWKIEVQSFRELAHRELEHRG